MHSQETYGVTAQSIAPIHPTRGSELDYFFTE